MRWFVEVSRVGDSTPAERYCLDAKAWQAALQETRKLRGDSGPLSKFSIELLDDGYRAVDPIQKIRYLVSHAPADAELLAPTTVNGARETSRPSASRPSASPGPSAPPAPTQSTAPHAPSGFAAAEIGSSPGALALALRKSAPPTPVAARSSTAPAAIESIVPRPSAAPKNPGPSAPRPSPKTAGVSVAPPSATAPAASATALQVANFQAPQPSTAPNVAMKPAPVLSVLPEPARPIEVLPPQRATEAKDVGPVPSLPDFEVVLSRKQTPTKDTPISYRELAYAVPQGTQRADVELLLLERLEFCRQELSAQPAGKLVQIAVFDHVFTQRPLRAPLGTLAWKDWRGAAVLAYPAFGEPSPPVTDSLPPPPPPSESEELETAPVSRGGEEAQPIPLAKPITHAPRPDPNETPPLPAALKSAPIPAAAIVPVTPQPTASAVVTPSSPVVSDAAQTPVPEVAIVLPIAELPAPVAAPAEAAIEVAAPPEVLAPPQAAAFAAPPPAAATTRESPSTPPEASTSRSSQPPAVSEHRSSRPRLFTGVRRPGEDLISDLFERMHELHFERDIPRGVEFAINATLEVLPCAITMVQVFDINTRQFVVVRARGEGASRAVLHRTPDSDPLIVEVMRRGRTRTYNAEQDKRFAQGRWSHLQRPPKQVLCAPVRQGGRYLGLLELADPQGGAPFHVTEINAVDYICEQLADFIANRPIVLDSDVILPK